MSKAAIQPVAVDDVEAFDHVPGPARHRYWNLVSARDAAFDKVTGMFDRLTESRNDKLRAEREFHELEDALERGQLLRRATPDEAPYSAVRDDGRLAAAHRRFDAAADRYSRAKIEHDGFGKEASIFGRLVRRADDYILATKGKHLRLADSVKLDLRRETLVEALDRARQQIAGLKAEVRSLSTGPGSIADAKAAMRAEIAKLAAEGEPDVSALFRATRPTIGWPMWTMPNFNVNGYMVRTINGAALLAAVYRDDLIAFLDKRIDAYGAGVEGEMLSAKERAERLAEIERQMLDLSYREAALLDQAANEHTNILPRADADIRAVLWLAPDSPNPLKIGQ